MIRVEKSAAQVGERPIYRLNRGNLHIGILLFREGEYQFKAAGWTKEDHGWTLTAKDCSEIHSIATKFTEDTKETA